MQTKPTRHEVANIEAEQAVLGAVLLDNDAILRVTEILDKGHFYRESHRYIFRAMQTLRNQGDRIDLITLSARMRRDKSLEKAGGESYLGALVDSVPSAAGVESHARMVMEKAVLRDLGTVGTLLIEGSNDNPDPKSLIAQTKRTLDKLEREVCNIESILSLSWNWPTLPPSQGSRLIGS